MIKSTTNALIDDGTNLIDMHLEDSQIPEGSITRMHRGIWKHLLVKDKDNKDKYLIPNIPEVTRDTISPSDLYDALEDKDSPELLSPKEHPGKKWAITALWVFIDFALFILFIMWIVSRGDNKQEPNIPSNITTSSLIQAEIKGPEYELTQS